MSELKDRVEEFMQSKFATSDNAPSYVKIKELIKDQQARITLLEADNESLRIVSQEDTYQLKRVMDELAGLRK
jgi:cell shape-determining protein MreC